MDQQTKQIIAGVLVTIGIFTAGFGVGYSWNINTFINEFNTNCSDYLSESYGEFKQLMNKNLSKAINYDPILN